MNVKRKELEGIKRKNTIRLVSIKREDVDRISRETGIEPNKVKKYLAGIKLSQALTKEEKEKIKECLKTEVSKGNSVS